MQSKRPDAVENAEILLQKMYDLWNSGDRATEPSNVPFNVVINSWAKSYQHFAARRAYSLLQQMQASENCKPDIISYTSVIESFSRSSDPEAAEISLGLLQQVTDMYEETGQANLMPNLRTYTMAILVLSKHANIRNVVRARELLTRLEESYEETKDDALRPNEYPYNYVLNCAANCLGTTEERLKAFQIATITYKELRKSKIVSPDSFTYAFWFKCCNNLLSEGELRTKCISYAFDQCKEDGLVSAEVLNRLLAGTPPTLLSKLLSVPPQTSPTVYRSITLDDIPPSWSRNVRLR